jgi:hypothetical protein
LFCMETSTAPRMTTRRRGSLPLRGSKAGGPPSQRTRKIHHAKAQRKQDSGELNSLRLCAFA